jgi:hypothetical protein
MTSSAGTNRSDLATAKNAIDELHGCIRDARLLRPKHSKADHVCGLFHPQY